jgi:YVTN family beta-propeller protein
LQGVASALTSCFSVFPVDGICRRPGPDGLELCPENTDVRISKCTDRQRCLKDPSAREEIGAGKIDAEGRFSFALDSVTVAGATLVYEADVEPATPFRGLNFGPLAAGSGAGIDDDVVIDPNSEAAVRLVDESGLGNLSDDGVEAVIETVQIANADLSFAGLDAAAAASMATDEASQDASVTTAIEEAKVTPVLVTNLADNTVSVADSRTNKGLYTATVGMNPLGIAVTADMAFAFVVNRGDSATTEGFSIIDIRSRTVQSFPGYEPDLFDQSVGVAINPDEVAYVANRNTSSVDVIFITQAMFDPTTARVTRIVDVGLQPASVAAARSEPFVYVGLAGGNGVAVIDTTDNHIESTVDLPSGALSVTLTPDDRILYVARNDVGSDVNHVSVIDTQLARSNPSAARLPDIEVGAKPVGVAVAPAGDFAYVVNSEPGSESLSVIAVSSQSVVATVGLPAGSEPLGVAVTPDGRSAYVGLRAAASMVVIDTEKARTDPNNARVATVPVGQRPQIIVASELP